MKVSIVLVLVALAGVLDLAIGEKYRDWIFLDLYPIEDVVEKLGQRIRIGYSDSGLAQPHYGPYVYDILTYALNKDAKVILGQYSANDLIALGEWDSKDCSVEELEKRGKNCEQFSTKEEAAAISPVKNSKEGYTRLALGYYCWAVVEHIEERCPLLQVRQEIGADLEALDALKKKIESAERKPIAQFFESGLTSQIIFKHYLAKEEKSAKGDALKSTCSKIVDRLDDSDVWFNDEWKVYLELCKKIVS